MKFIEHSGGKFTTVEEINKSYAEWDLPTWGVAMTTILSMSLALNHDRNPRIFWINADDLSEDYSKIMETPEDLAFGDHMFVDVAGVWQTEYSTEKDLTDVLEFTAGIWRDGRVPCLRVQPHAEGASADYFLFVSEDDHHDYRDHQG